jgi:hypothetical protein
MRWPREGAFASPRTASRSTADCRYRRGGPAARSVFGQGARALIHRARDVARCVPSTRADALRGTRYRGARACDKPTAPAPIRPVAPRMATDIEPSDHHDADETHDRKGHDRDDDGDARVEDERQQQRGRREPSDAAFQTRSRRRPGGTSIRVARRHDSLPIALSARTGHAASAFHTTSCAEQLSESIVPPGTPTRASSTPTAPSGAPVDRAMRAASPHDVAAIRRDARPRRGHPSSRHSQCRGARHDGASRAPCPMACRPLRRMRRRLQASHDDARPRPPRTPSPRSGRPRGWS